MADIGHAALGLILAVSFYATFIFMLSPRWKDPELSESAIRALWAGGMLTTFASALLFYLLLSHDFQIEYVYEHTSTYLPTPYLLSAFWAGQEGSLLLWLWFLSILTFIVTIWGKRHGFWSRITQIGDEEDALRPYALAVLAFVQGFLALLLVAVSDPFAALPFRPDEGFGLNPLLQNFWMIVHPPVVFIGYAGYTVPFAFAFAALATGHLEGRWLRRIRFWNLLAWLFLSAGILIGAWWAYLELGWGGYWGWDPVENSSLLPWLVGTAFLHSALVQERRGMFKKWNFALVTLTFVLCLFATFVTRSGVIQSVHAFGQSSLGPFFMALMLLCLAGGFGLLFRRRRKLQGEGEPEDFLSRESAFLVGNLLFCGAAAAVLLGTVYPALTELVQGVQVALGASFYQRVVGPVSMAVLALLGLCPFLRWRRSTGKELGRNVLPSGAFALIVSGVLLGLGVRGVSVLLPGALCAFVGGGALLEIGRGLYQSRAHPPAIWKGRRRYGAYLVHLAVVLMAVGAIGESNFKIEKQLSLAPGERIELEGYHLEYESFVLADRSQPDRERYTVTLNVYRNGQLAARLVPEKNFHWNIEQWVTEVSLYRTLKEDLYVVLGWLEEDGLATFQVTINPLIIWLWIGGGVLVAGAVLAMWPSGRREQT